MGTLSGEMWLGLRVLVIASFFAFFAGYAWGRRRGKSEGFSEGLRFAPLELRRLTWERGHCVICGAGPCERSEESAPADPALQATCGPVDDGDDAGTVDPNTSPHVGGAGENEPAVRIERGDHTKQEEDTSGDRKLRRT